eukprot:1142874-Pelagomonas_calceolata.AAC.5
MKYATVNRANGKMKWHGHIFEQVLYSYRNRQRFLATKLSVIAIRRACCHFTLPCNHPHVTSLKSVHKCMDTSLQVPKITNLQNDHSQRALPVLPSPWHMLNAWRQGLWSLPQFMQPELPWEVHPFPLTAHVSLEVGTKPPFFNACSQLCREKSIPSLSN